MNQLVIDLIRTEEDLQLIHKGVLCEKRVVIAVGVGQDKIIAIAHNYHDEACDCLTFATTKSPYVHHAEPQVLLEGVDTIYSTFQPCLSCAHKIVAHGSVHSVYYRDQDEVNDGINYLRSHNVQVFHQWIENK